MDLSQVIAELTLAEDLPMEELSFFKELKAAKS